MLTFSHTNTTQVLFLKVYHTNIAQRNLMANIKVYLLSGIVPLQIRLQVKIKFLSLYIYILYIVGI